MPHPNPEFWNIVESNFPDAAADRRLEIQVDQRARLGADEADIRWEQIVAASYDGRIADFEYRSSISEEFLRSQLQRDYGLTEQEVEQAIDRGIGQLHELVDFNDET